jgi:hypothetical protein
MKMIIPAVRSASAQLSAGCVNRSMDIIAGVDRLKTNPLAHN